MLEIGKNKAFCASAGDWKIVRAAGRVFIMAPGIQGQMPVAEIFIAGGPKEQEANAAVLAAAKPLYSFTSRVMESGVRLPQAALQDGFAALRKAQGRIP